MTEGINEEIKRSIKSLSEYKDRLSQELLDLARKLKMPQTEINQTLGQHPEINKVKLILHKLEESIKEEVEDNNERL
tara:strand:- start:1547 stop:1777 length:231 start_codon:yes stop_codon:yes gene_type:complete